MMLVVAPVLLLVVGFMLLFLTRLYPILDMIYLPEMGYIFAVGSVIFLLYRLYVADTFKQTDKVGKGKHLINYLRRDNEVVPIYGKRAYPGESFIDVVGLGLVEFLGKDCFYTWGDKKVIWGLENINFTPDPRYFNLCHLFWEVGFTDSDDVYRVLNGLDLELMGRVYLNMLSYDDRHGVNRLINDLKEYDGDKVVFKPDVGLFDSVKDSIDMVIHRDRERK